LSWDSHIVSAENLTSKAGKAEIKRPALFQKTEGRLSKIRKKADLDATLSGLDAAYFDTCTIPDRVSVVQSK